MAWPNGTRLKTFVAGGSHLPGDTNNIEDRMLQIAGYRGKSIIATEESRTNTALGLLTTPDQVAGIVLPTDGLIFVAYQALWKSAGGINFGNAAIFLGATQVKIADNAAAAPAGQLATVGSAANTYETIATQGGGLARVNLANSQVTTGQIVGTFDRSPGSETGLRGGPCCIFAAAGTYTISVQFKASAGSVTVKDRKLWVWTEAFA